MSGVNNLAKGSSHNMWPCDHEEADTRLLVRFVDTLRNGLKNGCRTCLITHCRYCTGVVLTIISKFYHLLTYLN